MVGLSTPAPDLGQKQDYSRLIVIPADAGIHSLAGLWMPARAGMISTGENLKIEEFAQVAGSVFAEGDFDGVGGIGLVAI